MKIKTILLLLALCVTMSVSAQMRYHDVELSNAKGEVIEMSSFMGTAKTNAMKYQFSDYQYDSKGNWLSRKQSYMGKEDTYTRTIEYY